LDDTGLYYYGARYYDPTIGRFISADTIVQNAANPQTLNRYSYCLNNPLKYIDPSGLRVYIGRTDVSVLKGILDQINEAEEFGCEPSAALMAAFWDAYNGLGNNGLDLLEAWEKLGNVAPDLAEELENAEQTAWISYGNVPTIAGAATEQVTGGYAIRVSMGVRGEDTSITAARLGHESFHTAERMGGMSGLSVANEAFAYSFGFQVASELGTEIAVKFAKVSPLSAELQYINPDTDKRTLGRQLEYARGAINRSLSQALGEDVKVPWGKWPGFLGIGGNRFLDVAKNVWIK
jgi:RHS repeat-associated protein